MTVLNLEGRFQYLELQADSSHYHPKQHRCLLQSPTHPADQRLTHSGDSRDKDGVDEVGGIKGGGGCLPGPKQWVKVAAVQD